jgi:hypothetical protein
LQHWRHSRVETRAYGIALEKEDEAHADIINRLRMVKSRHPIAPLFEGRWE